MARFVDKAFVVTGGTSGIGFSTALSIAQEGGQVLVTGTNIDRLRAAEQAHSNVQGFLNDAADFDAAEVLAEEVTRRFGRIDGASINAGKGGGALLGNITPELYRELFDLNVGGALFSAQALSGLVKDGGSLVLMSSLAKDKGMAGGAVYSAAKGAVRSMTRALARELISRQVRVNTVSPGPTITPFFKRTGRSDEAVDQMQDAFCKANPMGRMGTAEEVASVVLFLLSDESSYVTGSDYAVDGGEAQL
ncbi:MAG TPA: SDR family oxidoreductase [Alphaproteobacteria bacterium]|nr:SDR family oxidoreductase [Alphaproteobacteria bacterium]|tara:strand:+ start:4422 stop:5168 length:747 start_codon:yes stop_codon:yes gene_type:complete